MPIIRNKMELKDDDILRIQEAMARSTGSTEKTISDYLHESGAQILIDDITRFIPVSKKGKRHAKRNQWYDQENYNMAVGIANNLKGKRGTSFYYLYYVATGTGTSRKKGGIDFMEKGEAKAHSKMVDGVVAAVTKNIEEEIN